MKSAASSYRACILGMLCFGALSPTPTRAQCEAEVSHCYRLFRYSYQGGSYCMRFYDGSFQYYGVAGSLEGVAYANFHQMVYNAWLNWYQNADLGFITEGASTDTSGNNCRIGVLSSQTFGGLGFGYTVGGGGALMISRYSPGSGGNIRTDGTIKFGRTYVRGDADADFAWVE